MSSFSDTKFYEKPDDEGGITLLAVDNGVVTEVYQTCNSDGDLCYVVNPNSPIVAPHPAARRWEDTIYKCLAIWRRDLFEENERNKSIHTGNDNPLPFQWRINVTPDNGAEPYKVDGRSATMKDAQWCCAIWMNGNKEARRTYREVQVSGV